MTSVIGIHEIYFEITGGVSILEFQRSKLFGSVITLGASRSPVLYASPLHNPSD